MRLQQKILKLFELVILNCVKTQGRAENRVILCRSPNMVNK